jgi:hypothetical protein
MSEHLTTSTSAAEGLLSTLPPIRKSPTRVVTKQTVKKSPKQTKKIKTEVTKGKKKTVPPVNSKPRKSPSSIQIEVVTPPAPVGRVTAPTSTLVALPTRMGSSPKTAASQAAEQVINNQVAQVKHVEDIDQVEQVKPVAPVAQVAPVAPVEQVKQEKVDQVKPVEQAEHAKLVEKVELGKPVEKAKQVGIKKSVPENKFRGVTTSPSYPTVTVQEEINVLLVLPAIGEPNFSEKLGFLKHNVRMILSTAPTKANFYMDVSCYKLTNLQQPILPDVEANMPGKFKEINPRVMIRQTIQEAIQDLPNKERLINKNIKVRQERGVVGQFLYHHVKPWNYSHCDYVFMFLDDIKLSDDFKFDLLLEVHYLSGLDILSPALTLDSAHSYDYMLENHNKGHDAYGIRKVRQTSILEFFCYFMSFEAYNKYYNTFLNENSRWLWGVDLALTSVGLTVGIYDYLTMRHYYQTTNHKEQYGKHVPLPKEEKKLMAEKFGLQEYKLLNTITI